MHHQELTSAKYLQEDDSKLVATLTPTATAEQLEDQRYTRGLILAAIFIPVAVAWFYILPFIQAPMLPKTPGGIEGPWLLRPSLGGRFLGCLFPAAITTWLISMRLRKQWRARDVIVGRPLHLVDRYPILKIVLYIMIVKYLLVSGTFLVLYLFSWCSINPNGIEVRMPWGTTHYSFAKVQTLRLESREHLHLSNKNDKYGYDIQFVDGRTWYFTLKNEGLSETELAAVVTFLSKQTGKDWHIIPTNKGRRR